MPNQIAVEITADVAGLTVKRAVMSAELKAAMADLNAFAKTANTSGMTKELQASMLGAADKAGKARAQIALLNAEVKNLGAGSGGESPFAGLGKGLDQVKGAAESLSAVRASVMGLGEAIGAAFAVEGLLEWGRKMGEAGEKTEHTAQILGTSIATVQQLTAGFTIMGLSADTGVMGLERLDKAFAKARDGGKEQADVFKQLGVSTTQNYTQMQMLGAVMDGFAKQADGPAKAAEAMALFGRSGAALIPFLDLGSKGLAQINDLTMKYGVVNEEAVEKSAQLGSAFNENKVAMSGVSNMLAAAFAPALTSTVQGMNDLIASWVASYKAGGLVKVGMDALVGSFKFVIDTLALLGVAADYTFKTIDGGVWMLQGILTAGFSAIVGSLNVARDSFVMFGEVARDALTLNWGRIGSDIQNGLARVSADVSATTRKMGRDAAAGFAQGSKEWQSSDQDVSGYESWSKKMWAGQPRPQMKSAGEGEEGDTSGDVGKAAKGGGASRVSAMENELRQAEYDIKSQTNDWSKDMQAFEVQFWQAKLDAAKKGTAEYREILGRLEEAKLAAGTHAAQQSRQTSESDTSTNLSVQKTEIGDQRGGVDADYQAAKITAQEKHDLLAKLAQQEADDEIAAQEAKKVAYGADVAAVHEAANQELQIRATLKAQLDELERQLTEDTKREADRRVEAARKASEEEAAAHRRAADGYKQANEEIMGAEDKLVSGILSGRESMSQIELGIAKDLVQKEIENDLHYLTQKVLFNAEGLASDQMTAKGGLLVSLLGLTQKTAATVSANTTQTASTVAAQATQTAAQVAGAGAGLAASKAMNQQTVAQDAGVAAAGAYAAVSNIPLIGPLLAPEAAAVAYAGTMAFGGFAKGLDVVPRDMIAQIHAGERIMPAADNSAMIAAIRGGASGNSGGNTGGGGADRGSQTGAAGHTFKFGDVNFHGSSRISASDVERMFDDHRHLIADRITELARRRILRVGS